MTRNKSKTKKQNYQKCKEFDFEKTLSTKNFE